MVFREIQLPELSQVSDFRSYTGQVIFPQGKDLQVFQLINLWREFRQRVVVEVQFLYLLHPDDFPGYLLDLILREINPVQYRQEDDLPGKFSKLVPYRIKALQVVEFRKFFREFFQFVMGYIQRMQVG